MRLFSDQRVADGYAHHRPRFHSAVLERAAVALGITGSAGRLLDVGCGTGLSTGPLGRLTRCAVGIDRAHAMIRAAEPGPGVRYAVASGEHPPFRPSSFDGITVAGALNWLDRGRFLAAARELLLPRGWLLIYDGGDLGHMVDDDSFHHWHIKDYAERLPRPPRDERPVTAGEARAYGLSLVLSDSYTLELPFDLDSYVSFVLTESRVTVAVEERKESLEAIRAWLVDSLKGHFRSDERQVLFGGPIWGLRRM